MNNSDSYILFIDESGKSQFSDSGNNFLLSGLIINKDLHSALSNYMVSLKEKSDIPIDENIHAFDLLENEKRRIRRTGGGTIYKRIPYTKINAFFLKLCSLIEGADLKSLIFRIKKERYSKKIRSTALKHGVSERAIISYLKNKDLEDFLYESLARKLILEFGHFLETENAHGEIIAESRRENDGAVLRAFIASTNKLTFSEDSHHYRNWAENSFKRIHSLTFQNKRGLSFGLEIADFFGWAHINKMYGRGFPVSSIAKSKRIEVRIGTANKLLTSSIYKKKLEDITQTKLITIAGDLVSEFTEALVQYRNTSVPSGTPPGNPDGP